MSSRINSQRSPESGTTTIADTEFAKFDLGGDKLASAQIVATGLDAADGVVSIQQSNDGSNWDDSGVSYTLAANGSNTFELVDVATRFIRVKMEQGSNTTGELYVEYVSK
jgi:hypothetical protein